MSHPVAGDLRITGSSQVLINLFKRQQEVY